MNCLQAGIAGPYFGHVKVLTNAISSDALDCICTVCQTSIKRTYIELQACGIDSTCGFCDLADGSGLGFKWDVLFDLKDFSCNARQRKLLWRYKQRPLPKGLATNYAHWLVDFVTTIACDSDDQLTDEFYSQVHNKRELLLNFYGGDCPEFDALPHELRSRADKCLLDVIANARGILMRAENRAIRGHTISRLEQKRKRDKQRRSDDKTNDSSSSRFGDGARVVSRDSLSEPQEDRTQLADLELAQRRMERENFITKQAEAKREDEARQRKAESERLAREEKEASEKAANLAKAKAWAAEEARKKAAEEVELAAIEAEYAREAEALRLERERSEREARAKEEREQAEAAKKLKDKKASDERERLRLERLRGEERRREEDRRAKLRAEERALANYDPAYVDALSGHDYEDYWRKLLTKRGASSVRWVGRDGSDGGADITFEWQGRRVAVQCKRTSSSVGVTALYEVTHGLKVYQCAVPWVVTNGSFTAPAERRASETGVVLVAGDPTVFLDSFFGVSDRVAA